MSCQGCIERHLGCHSLCESYLEYKKLKEAYNKDKFYNSKMGIIRTDQIFKRKKGQR
jgi:hypothetical protein